ncbi:MAG TPA: RNA polymerase sigma factor [Planctomycetota bacterium]|nr:RNA polymerase sigma factor [Planctomycetota bacterium]
MFRDSSDHPSDIELVRGAEAGSPSAVRELLRRLCCVPVILRSRNARMGSPLDESLLQDVAQDVLIAVWNRLDRFGGDSTLEAWVYRFCVHKHLATVRNRGRRVRIEAVHSPALESSEAPADEVEGDGEMVHLALEDLETELESVVRLKHFDELTFDQIGRRLDVSPNTAKSRYYRALGRMREYFASRGRRLS